MSVEDPESGGGLVAATVRYMLDDVDTAIAFYEGK